MIEQRHPARPCASPRHGDSLPLPGLHADTLLSQAARRIATSCAVILLLGLSGCRHKPVRSPFPIGVLAPVDLEMPPASDSTREIATLPPPELGPLSSPEPPAPRRRPAAPAKESPAPPTQVANNDASAVLAIGALSAGGEDVTHTAQEAQDLINAVLKRIGGLPSELASARKKDIRQIRDFVDKAQKALRSGDADGANTLATKARLLMDDVEKK